MSRRSRPLALVTYGRSLPKETPRLNRASRLRSEGPKNTSGLQIRIAERSTPTMKLYVFPPSPRAMKVVALAEHLQLEHETRLVDLTKGEQMKPEFTALNPNQRMPVIEDDGFVLWESNAILQYLASKKPAAGLWPSDPRRQADVSRWQNWEASHWAPACGTLAFERLVKKLLGQGDADPAAVAEGEQDVR